MISLTKNSSRFLVKRGLSKDYKNATKAEGELFYLTDTNQLANHKHVYKTSIDGGYFGDQSKKVTYENYTDGGEF